MKDLELKEIEAYPGYKAGSDGNIYSFRTTRIGGYDYKKAPKKLKSSPDSMGKYLIVALRKNGKSHTKTVHRIICETFNGKPIGKQDTSHLDGNNKNNLPENLVWESRQKNLSRRKGHGVSDIGVRNTRALFNLDQLIQIRKWLAQGITSVEISRRMLCNYRDIGKIKRGERYRGQGTL